ncbi:MAG: peptide chain release factor 1 [Lentisphaerae bacterium RIFOXYC12_FULL_60_16]|nr:MAG: peptide chain release factor 1 [Lentisphaerae bacterium RIFOXYC12_FULL_60_16]OGV68499.1 MAG: peptide chain release factor 1 [Lentisphaerae bacterium RIFOXYA12_FULL_60_10]OGV81055.1 MAG: peptide chain release factor 1 [Lentisphaerae bacterium RIFOXYB12_FULL_60_10]
MVSSEKQVAQSRRMQVLGVREHDLVETFILGSGKGGQKVNKTASCVDLLHRPSGIRVKCQATRSRALNRFMARRALCDRLTERLQGIKSEREREVSRIRRQKRRRSRRQKERMLADKRHHAAVKQGRVRTDWTRDGA